MKNLKARIREWIKKLFPLSIEIERWKRST